MFLDPAQTRKRLHAWLSHVHVQVRRTSEVHRTFRARLPAWLPHVRRRYRTAQTRTKLHAWQPHVPHVLRTLEVRSTFRAWFPLALALIVLLTAGLLENYLANPDMGNYQCYARSFWYGAKGIPASGHECKFIPNISRFHSLPLEYPPLSVLVFSLPLAGPAAGYPALFALWMAGMVCFIYWLLLQYGPPRAAVLFTFGLLAGGMGTSLTRFDMVPAALSLACLILAERKHWTLAHAALALAVLIKGYPIVLFPFLFLSEQCDRAGFLVIGSRIPLKMIPGVLLQAIRNVRYWRWKNALIFTGLLVVVTGCFWGLSSAGAFNWLSYMRLRPFEVESTGSVLLWVASLSGVPIGWEDSFGSKNITSPMAGALSQGLMILLVAGYCYIFFQQWRGKMKLIQVYLVALLVLIATDKVFSPQYLLWVMPLMAMVGSADRKLWRVWVGICCLTTLIYPVYFGIMANNPPGPQLPGFMPLILVRDGLFVVLTVAYFRTKEAGAPGTTGAPFHL